MNENGGFPDPGLVSDLARSIAPMPSPDLILRARRLVALREAAATELPERWAHELAASICARVFAAEDSGEEPTEIIDEIAELVEQRWRNAGTYWGWKNVGFARAVRICVACVHAWKGTER